MDSTAADFINILKEHFGDDFIFDAETSAMLTGLTTEPYEDIYVMSNRVNKETTLTIEGKNIIARPIPDREYQLVEPHILSARDIIITLVNKEGLLTADSWDTSVRTARFLEPSDLTSMAEDLSIEDYQNNIPDLMDTAYNEGD